MKRKTNLLWLALAFVVIAGTGIFLFRDQIFPRTTLNLGKQLPFTMVEFYGDTTLLMNLHSNLNTTLTPQGAATPASDNTLFHFFDDSLSTFYLYQKGDGRKINYQIQAGQLRINGNLNTVIIDSTEASGRWLSRIRKDSVSQLRMVVLGQNLPESWYPALFRLAGINPRISFLNASFAEMEGKDSILMQGLWKATFPAVAVGSEQNLPFIDLSETRALFLEKADSLLPAGFFESLAKMPKNGKIWLDGFEENEIGQILKITQPQELSIESTEIEKPGTLALWGELKSLFVRDTLADLQPLAALPHLEWLSGYVSPGASGIDGIRHLRYLGIDTDTSTLRRILANNPDLQYLNLNLDSFPAFPDLKGLDKLTALTLPKPDSTTDINPLRDLKNLHYLGASANDSILQVMQPYCPDCMVYGQGTDFWGACLGSGWLLLIFPLLLFFVWIKRKP